MKRDPKWTFQGIRVGAFLVCLFGALAVAHAASVTYSKVVTLQLQGASNTDTVTSGSDNNTVKFDTGVNYFNTSNNFKLILKTTAIKGTGTYDVYLKAFILKDNATAPDIYYFYYEEDDNSTISFPVLKLSEEKKVLLEGVNKSQSIQLLDFPIEQSDKFTGPMILQAIAIDSDDNSTYYGMDAKMFFWNWLDAHTQ